MADIGIPATLADIGVARAEVAAKTRLKLVEAEPAPIAPAPLLQPEFRNLP